MTASPGFPTAPTGGQQPKSFLDAASTQWVRRLAEIINNMMRGKLNVVASVTLNANATTTVVNDARISGFSALLLQPMTAHAAAALYSSTSVLVTSQLSGSATLTHASDANTDKTFNLVIIG